MHLYMQLADGSACLFQKEIYTVLHVHMHWGLTRNYDFSVQ